MIPIIAAILSGIGLLGGGLVMYTRVIQHLTRIESMFDQHARLASHIPGLYARVDNLERQLGVSAPELPNFFNGASEE